jgi:recombinational DNA repair protein RecR
VLGGVISPNGWEIGPDELKIDSLIERCNSGNVREAIMALNPTIEERHHNFLHLEKVAVLTCKK